MVFLIPVRHGGRVNPRVADSPGRCCRETRSTARRASSSATVSGDDVYDLFYWANRIRIQFVGRDVKFCAIVAAKVGGCSEDCKFCARSERRHPRLSRAGETHRPAVARQRGTRRRWARIASASSTAGAPAGGAGRRLKPIMTKIATEENALQHARRATPETAKFSTTAASAGSTTTSRPASHYPNIVSSPLQRARQHAESGQGGGPVALLRRDLRHGRGMGRPAGHAVHAPRDRRGRHADQLPQCHPRHAPVRPARAAADGVFEDHLGRAFVLPDKELKVAGGARRCCGICRAGSSSPGPTAR